MITPDRRLATMAFGIRLMPLDRQQKVIEEMRNRLDPPPGVNAQVVGLPVLAAEANAKVSLDWRRLLAVLGSLLLARSAARGLPPSGACARAACPDRPGRRLVGARVFATFGSR